MIMFIEFEKEGGRGNKRILVYFKRDRRMVQVVTITKDIEGEFSGEKGSQAFKSENVKAVSPALSYEA